MTQIPVEQQNPRAVLELLYHISRELASALDLRTVLQRVLFLAVKNVGAISGSLIVLDSSGDPVEGAIIHGAQLHDRVTEQLRVTLEQGMAGWVIRNRQPALINDTSQDGRWLRRPDDEPTRTGAKSAVAAPLLVREAVVGVITLVHPQPGFFTMDHLELVQTIADQAGIAVLNGRLYDESQRKARVMTALAETAAVINASLSLEEVLQRIVNQTGQALRVRAASLALIDPSGAELEFKASAGWELQHNRPARVKIGEEIAGEVAEEGQDVIAQDMRVEPYFNRATAERLGFNPQAIACAPIFLRGQVIGIIEAVNPLQGTFDPDARLVLRGIGNLAGTAIQHAQLYESLGAAHQRYHDLFEDSIDLIFITDADGLVSEANRQALGISGYPEAEIYAAKMGDLLSPPLDSDENRAGLPFDSNLVRKGGEHLPVQVFVRQFDINGSHHLQWILRDVSERKKLDRLREDLISMIYHDLRSPLANVVSSLDVLAAGLPDEKDETFVSILKIAMRSTERIQRLTNSLLDVNRLQSGQPVQNQMRVPVPALVQDALEVVEIIASTRGLKLSTELAEALPDVYVDSDMIRRVIINLLENAVRYTQAEGQIAVGAHVADGWVYIWVKDSGRGIPLQEQELIFDKFTRLRSAEDKSRGLGLGLTFCRLAVEAHGGKIWVESEPGKGSLFTFTLPSAAE